MASSLEIKNLGKVLDSFKKLKEEIAEEIISKGLDNTLNEELKILKKDLLKILNTSGKTRVRVSRGATGFEDITLDRANNEMIKALTDADLQKSLKVGNYEAMIQNKVAVTSSKRLKQAQVDKLSSIPQHKMASGLDVVIPMRESDTLESHLAQATKYFNSALFVIFDENGRAKYYKNPGIDLSKHVKIVCSNTTGNSERSQQVFDRNKTGKRIGNRQDSTRAPKDYAMYSLKSEAFDIIKNHCLDLTEVVESMKYGDYDKAVDIVSGKPLRNESVTDLLDRVNKFKEGRELLSSTESYRNLIELIKNLKLKKTSKKDRTYYTLITKYDENIKDPIKFEEAVQREILVWKIDGSHRWVEKLLKEQIKRINKLIG